MGRTLLDKIWDAHVVREEEGGRCVLYIDRQYIHEVTSPVAFAGIERRGLHIARPERITATADHNIPTLGQELPIEDAESRRQVATLAENCARHGIEHFGIGDPRQGIVHIIGPESGLTQPGMTIVCGDSHTSTHGALGAVAFGVGTSEVEMVFASQCILQPKPRAMRITVDGVLPGGVEAKDLILHVIAQIGVSGGTGHFIEFAGEAIRSLPMEGAHDRVQHEHRMRRPRRHDRPPTSGRSTTCADGPASRRARRSNAPPHAGCSSAATPTHVSTANTASTPHGSPR